MSRHYVTKPCKLKAQSPKNEGLLYNVPEYRNITELKDLLRKRLEAMTAKVVETAG